ncbi:Membrane associated serine protease, rhomboid family [Aquimonas voraii]|uniref:Membrane associated serine protease, rhomboid family n=2 Tax=Aquimonas voraii TaxID=265719 RepID=A0A1G6RQ88_9GAMM|nr:Membrane associated serine protease, rhomboid family [Aquimonas voraii]
MPPVPPVTKALLLACGLVYVLQLMLGEVAMLPFMLWPAGDYALGVYQGQMISVGFLPWQLFTYGFMHGGEAHLIFNLLALWMFGGDVERVLGPRRFLLYVLTCIVGAGLIQLGVATLAAQSGEPYPTVGASGGVFGVLLAFGMAFPNRQVMLLIPPIPMKARTLVVVYGVVELVLGITGTRTGIAHFAHLGGMLFGFLLLQYWRGRWPFERRRP